MRIDSTGGHGVDVALTEHDVVVATDLDLVAILGAEEDSIPDFGTTYVLAQGHDLGPHETFGDLRGRWNEDSPTAAPFPFLVGYAHEETIVQHLDGKLLLRRAGSSVDHGESRYRRPVAINTVTLTTIDGIDLEGDFRSADGEVIGSAVLAHPHPLYGGDRWNPVVDALFDRLPILGFHCLRFDFRGVGASGGEHDGGDSERLDVAAAIDFVCAVADEPAWIVGYSFGSMVALNVVEPRVSGWVAVAPPLGTTRGRILAAEDPRPKLVLAPAHDQFTDAESARHIVGSWTSASISILDSADHFLNGHTATVATRVGDWLVSRA
ncbi:MAG: hypothetical protein RL391_868 [Actinomycetota bacterium]